MLSQLRPRQGKFITLSLQGNFHIGKMGHRFGQLLIKFPDSLLFPVDPVLRLARLGHGLFQLIAEPALFVTQHADLRAKTFMLGGTGRQVDFQSFIVGLHA